MKVNIAEIGIYTVMHMYIQQITDVALHADIQKVGKVCTRTLVPKTETVI